MKLSSGFLPVNMTDLQANGWDFIDIVLVSGDAYIDHPAFGVSLLGRFLINAGYRVGIISQPQTDDDFRALGRPRLFFGVTAGNLDSMVAHYTAQKKIRSTDAYSPNDRFGLRPDRATLIYAQKIKQLFKDMIVVLGGVEASMRRIPHYDFWSDKVRNSILIDTKASILVYGNAERQLLEIARRIQENSSLEGIKGTCTLSREKPALAVELYHIEQGQSQPLLKLSDPNHFYQMSKTFIENYTHRTIYYRHLDRFYVHYPPPESLTTDEIDEIYALPYTREIHPKYGGKRITAFEQIKFSVLSHRGCYGGCSFCIIGFHQGKKIQSRSKKSILSEIQKISGKKYFKGTITDIAGATANMYGTFCRKDYPNDCPRYSCIYPDTCKNLSHSERAYLSVLRAASQNAKVKHVYISSGVRHDLALSQPDFTQEMCFFHTSGSLKLAPEHTAISTLRRMYKPSIEKYIQFSDLFTSLCKKLETKQYIIPYLIVGFPGTTLADAEDLRDFLKKNNIKVEQIQEFTPTPMTIATMMYFTGIDYDTGEKIHVPKGKEIRVQKELAIWHLKR
jgi:uncharacterized radical SAM protein YgiQ